MAEDRANNPARRPNLGLPDFVKSAVKSEHRYKSPQPKVTVTKRTELPPALDTDVPFNDRVELAQKHLHEADKDYKESKQHG